MSYTKTTEEEFKEYQRTKFGNTTYTKTTAEEFEAYKNPKPPTERETALGEYNAALQNFKTANKYLKIPAIAHARTIKADNRSTFKKWFIYLFVGSFNIF